MPINFLKKKNFARSKLANNILDTDLSLTVLTGEGSKFPQDGPFRAAIWGASYASPEEDPNREIVEATYSSGDTFSIVRALEGTTAKAWNANDNFAHVLTAETIQEIEKLHIPSFSGLVIQNNSLDPNNDIDVTCDEAILQDANGLGIKVTNISLTITGDLDQSATGPTPNGRDDSNTDKSASTWYYIWLISDGSNVAGLLSTSPTNPNLPSGYSYKLLLDAIYNNSAGNFISIVKYGSTTYRNSVQALGDGNQTSYTAVPLTSLVPPIAKEVLLRTYVYSTTSSNAWGYIAADANGLGQVLVGGAAGGTTSSYSGDSVEQILKEQQKIYYKVASTNDYININVAGWRV